MKLGGKIDGLIINHGALEPIKRVADTSIEEWQKLFDINFFSPLALVCVHANKLDRMPC